MKIMINTFQIIDLLRKIGVDNFLKYGDVTLEDLNNVLTENINAPLISYIKVARRMNLIDIGQLIYWYDDDLLHLPRDYFNKHFS